jgi:uncharacterized membrane protein
MSRKSKLGKVMKMVVLATAVGLGGSLSTTALARGGGAHFGGAHFGGGTKGPYSPRALSNPSYRVMQSDQSFPLDRGIGNNSTNLGAYVREHLN